MTATDLLALLPLLVVAAAATVVLLAVAFRRDHSLAFGLTLVGLALALAALSLVPTAGSRRVTPLLVMDDYALFFMGLIFAASLVVALLSHDYMERLRSDPEEFYVLLLLAALGSAVLVASTHFASFFLGLEILSVSLYALIAYARRPIVVEPQPVAAPSGQGVVETGALAALQGGAASTRWERPSTRRDESRRPGLQGDAASTRWERGVEAGVKYLVLAGASSAFLLFGMALIYAELGTMELAGIASSQPAVGGRALTELWTAGLAMLVVGVGFKLAVAPFHMWTPDVYQGAPAPVTAFVATVSKGAVFALLLRYFTLVDVRLHGSLFLVFALIAVASMVAGNLLALLQDNVKRLLAYSSIAHLGYLLVAFLAGGSLAATAVAFYLVAYFVTTLGAFGVVGALPGRERDAEALEDYRGLVWRRPWLAGAFTAMLLSLAGIPLTAGFIGKFYVALAGVGSALWLLVMVLVLGSAIGVFYYLRVAVAMYARPPREEAVLAPAPPLSLAATVTLALLTLVLVGLGVYPGPLIRLIQAIVGGLA